MERAAGSPVGPLKSDWSPDTLFCTAVRAGDDAGAVSAVERLIACIDTVAVATTAGRPDYGEIARVIEEAMQCIAAADGLPQPVITALHRLVLRLAKPDPRRASSQPETGLLALLSTWPPEASEAATSAVRAVRRCCEGCRDEKMLNLLWSRCFIPLHQLCSGCAPAASYREEVEAAVGQCCTRITSAAPQLLACFEQRGADEATVKRLTSPIRFYTSHLIALEAAYPGCTLSHPREAARALVVLRLLTPPHLAVEWLVTTQWAARNSSFEQSTLRPALSSTEWRTGSRLTFLQELVSPPSGVEHVAPWTLGKLHAACSVLRASRLVLPVATPQEVDFMVHQLVPFVLSCAATEDPSIGAETLLWVQPPPSEPPEAPAKGVNAQGDGTLAALQPEQLATATAVWTALCCFCTVAPPSCLPKIESLLYEAVARPCPISFLMATEVWGYLRSRSDTVWGESAARTAWEVFADAAAAHAVACTSKDEGGIASAAFLIGRMQHVLRVLWNPVLQQEVVGEVEQEVAGSGPKAYLLSLVMHLPGEAVRSMAPPSIWPRCLAAVAAACEAGVLEHSSEEVVVANAMASAAALLKAFRLQPEATARSRAPEGCLRCLTSLTVARFRVNVECSCPVVVVDPKGDVSNTLRKLWRVVKAVLGQCQAGSSLPKPSIAASALEVSTAIIPILPQNVNLAPVADALAVLALESTPCLQLACVQTAVALAACKDVSNLPSLRAVLSTVASVKPSTPSAWHPWVVFKAYCGLQRFLSLTSWKLSDVEAIFTLPQQKSLVLKLLEQNRGIVPCPPIHDLANSLEDRRREVFQRCKRHRDVSPPPFKRPRLDPSGLPSPLPSLREALRDAVAGGSALWQSAPPDVVTELRAQLIKVLEAMPG